MLSESLIFLFLFFTQQIINEAAPLSIEIFHNEGPAKVMKSKIEIDDNLVQKLVSEKRMKDAATQTDPTLNYPNYKANEDYGEYNYDCAVPLMPDIVGYEIQGRDLTTQSLDFQTTQIRDTPSPSLLQSTIANINGIALNIMSLGFNLIGAVLHNGTTS